MTLLLEPYYYKALLEKEKALSGPDREAEGFLGTVRDLEEQLIQNGS
jgi:hypothetical protein